MVTRSKAKDRSDHWSGVLRDAGGPQAVGDVFGISAAAVAQWRDCPAERVLALEKATGISRHRIRPDIYPRERRLARGKRR